MNQSTTLASDDGLTTAEFAAQYLVKPQTVLKRYASTGSYHGVCPLRLPSRRLRWPADSIEALIANQSGGAS